MHFLEAFSSKIHRQVEFLLETQINLGAPSGAVCGVIGNQDKVREVELILWCGRVQIVDIID